MIQKFYLFIFFIIVGEFVARVNNTFLTEYENPSQDYKSVMQDSYNNDILLLGDDWRYGDVVGREHAKEVRFLPRVGGYASSNTIKRIHNL